MLFTYRNATAADQVYILDTDIKCFDFAWSPDAWAYAGEHYVIKLATYFRTPIGFATYLHDTENNIIQVPKIAVKAQYRNRNIGSKFVYEAVMYCHKLQAAYLQTIIPEALVQPGDPHDISGWLLKTGWKATALVRDFFPNMGQKQDGVQFTLNPYGLT